LTAHKGRGLNCDDHRAQYCSHSDEPNKENARALFAPKFNSLGAVRSLMPNFENLLQLLFREGIQVWPYLVDLTAGLAALFCWR
jgi:hypothetical protein